MMNTRNLDRDSLLLTAVLRSDEGQPGVKARVRNLSDGGMMAEGELTLGRGDRVIVELRNLRPVRGIVAWRQGSRIGIAFDETIDSKAPRAQPVTGESAAPRPTRPVGFARPDPAHLRKL